jgi:hypothetical protein
MQARKKRGKRKSGHALLVEIQNRYEQNSGGKENLPGLLRRQRPKFQERQAKILAQIKRSKNTAETSSRIEEQISTQKSLAAWLEQQQKLVKNPCATGTQNRLRGPKNRKPKKQRAWELLKTASARKLLAAPASSGRERLGESSDRGGEICGQRKMSRCQRQDRGWDWQRENCPARKQKRTEKTRTRKTKPWTAGNIHGEQKSQPENRSSDNSRDEDQAAATRDLLSTKKIAQIQNAFEERNWIAQHKTQNRFFLLNSKDEYN